MRQCGNRQFRSLNLSDSEGLAGRNFGHIIRGAMADTDQDRADFAEQLLHIHQHLAELRASVNVLKVFEAMRLNPVGPLKGLESLQRLEEKRSTLDPLSQLVKEAAEVTEALKKARELGGTHEA